MENIKSYTQFITESAKTDAIVDGVRQAIENGHSPEFTKDELTAFCRRGGGDGRTVTFLLTSDKAFLRKAGRGHNYFFDTEDGKTFMWHDLDAGDTATPRQQQPAAPKIVTQTLSKEEVDRIVKNVKEYVNDSYKHGPYYNYSSGAAESYGPLDGFTFVYETGELSATTCIGKYRGDGNPKDRLEVVKISNSDFNKDLYRECSKGWNGFALSLKGAVIHLINTLEDEGLIIANRNKVEVWHMWAW